jgi:hypothetical protein
MQALPVELEQVDLIKRIVDGLLILASRFPV